EYGAKLQECGAKLQECGAKLQEYGTKLQECGAKLREYGRKLQEYDAKLQEYGAKLQEYVAKLQESNPKKPVPVHKRRWFRSFNRIRVTDFVPIYIAKISFFTMDSHSIQSIILSIDFLYANM